MKKEEIENELSQLQEFVDEGSSPKAEINFAIERMGELRSMLDDILAEEEAVRKAEEEAEKERQRILAEEEEEKRIKKKQTFCEAQKLRSRIISPDIRHRDIPLYSNSN